jgi:hypothetical protein
MRSVTTSLGSAQPVTKSRVLVVDFGEVQNRRRPLAHFHRHGHVNPVEMASLLDEAGFEVIEAGSVGMGGLQFSLAVRDEPGC